MTIAVDNQIQLQLTNESQAKALFIAIDHNREHLSAFLPWVGQMQAIPVKLKFKKEGILRQAEFVNNEFLDLILYSLLGNEWNG